MNGNYADADRAIIIISDIEMGQGGDCDDFPHTNALEQFISKLNQPPYDQMEVDLVFNGDTFDFLKTSIDGEYPHLIDEDVALKKLALIENAHQGFFKGLRSFLKWRGPSRRAHFLVGNHDQELLFPGVQDRIIGLCAHSGQVHFPGFELKIGDMRIEHGSQQDDLFEVAPSKPFLNHNGKRILNLPWASVTLINAFIPFHSELYELDRIKPKAKVFERLPELREWLMARLWNYWTKDYLKEYITFSDPLKKVSWNMLREGFKRSLIFNPDVSMGQKLYKELESNEDIKLHVLGHGHDPKLVSYGDRKIIQAGCFRDEFMLTEGRGEEWEGEYKLIPKSYTEVLFKNNRAHSSNLREICFGECQTSRVPRSLGYYREYVKDMLKQEKSKSSSLAGVLKKEGGDQRLVIQQEEIVTPS